MNEDPASQIYVRFFLSHLPALPWLLSGATIMVFELLSSSRQLRPKAAS
jgi:hypothetical protein